MAVPNAFASASGSIALSLLDANFNYLTASPAFSGSPSIAGSLSVTGALASGAATFSTVAGPTLTALVNDLGVAGHIGLRVQNGVAGGTNVMTVDSTGAMYAASITTMGDPSAVRQANATVTAWAPATGGVPGLCAFKNVAATTDPVFVVQNGVAGGTTSAQCLATGAWQNTTNSYGAISDRERKQDFETAKSQTEDIKALARMTTKFRMKDNPDGPLQIGLIAQDVQQVSPGLVYDVDGTLGIAYSVLYMKAVKALGETIEMVEALRADFDAYRALHP